MTGNVYSVVRVRALALEFYLSVDRPIRIHCTGCGIHGWISEPNTGDLANSRFIRYPLIDGAERVFEENRVRYATEIGLEVG